MKTVLKIVKILVAIAMLGAVTGAFFGYPTLWACKIQPAATWTFLAVLIATPIVGRLFCECFCPLGIIQSFVNWLFHPFKKVRRVCTRLDETRAQQKVRWTVLAASAVLVASGFGAIGLLLTPYSIYGKTLTLFIPGVVIFAFVIASALFGKGRFWCNWICPVGTIFNLLAKKSVLGNKIGKSCGNCKACFAKKCPKAAAECGASPIASTPAAGDSPSAPDGAVDGLTRREVMKGIAIVSAVGIAEKTVDGGFAPISMPGSPDRPAAVLPPGSVDRKYFDMKCVGCGLCVKNCRGRCLRPSTALRRFGQPEMDFREGYCLVKCAQACAQICPAGAIRLIDGVSRKNIHAGHAIWKKDLCLRETQGVECKACSRKCPVGAIHIVEGFPVVDKLACIGCGACEHVCPVRPMPAIFVKGFERQRVIRPVGEADLIAEMTRLVSSGEAACVLAEDGVIVEIAKGSGVMPIMDFLRDGKLDGRSAVDKVIGRAAAAIYIVGKIKKVHTLLACEDAMRMLEANGIECSAEKIVPKILNRDLTGDCPIEKSVEQLADPDEMVKALKERFAK